MAVTTLDGEQQIRDAVGQHLGFSDWLSVTAESLALFGRATGMADISYLLLSVSNLFLPQIVEVRGFSMGINYGTDAVRFPIALVLPARIRGGATLGGVSEVRGGLQTEMLIAIATENDECVCTIESISRWLT